MHTWQLCLCLSCTLTQCHYWRNPAELLNLCHDLLVLSYYSTIRYHLQYVIMCPRPELQRLDIATSNQILIRTAPSLLCELLLCVAHQEEGFSTNATYYHLHRLKSCLAVIPFPTRACLTCHVQTFVVMAFCSRHHVCICSTRVRSDLHPLLSDKLMQLLKVKSSSQWTKFICQYCESMHNTDKFHNNPTGHNTE